MNFHKLRHRLAGAAIHRHCGLRWGPDDRRRGGLGRPDRSGRRSIPHFYNGNVEGIRDTGSDTTFFMMQKIGDLYTSAGLYGCTLNSATGQTLYNSL